MCYIKSQVLAILGIICIVPSCYTQESTGDKQRRSAPRSHAPTASASCRPNDYRENGVYTYDDARDREGVVEIFKNNRSLLTRGGEEHDVARIVVGHPKTMRGTESEQTQRVRDRYTQLQEHIPDIPCVLWDERLSSQRAEALETKKPRSKEEKRMSHARAAAFILDTHLQAHSTESE